jgi:hypothetical protein
VTDHSCPTNSRVGQAYCWRLVRKGYRVRFQDQVEKSVS